MQPDDLVKELLKDIDKAVESDAEDPRRRHLGASILGRRCAREVYYSFRWFWPVHHTGRLLRLFDRGQREETRMIGFLERLGFEVRAYSERLVYHEGSHSYSLLPWDQEPPPDVDDLTGIEWAMTSAKQQGLKITQHRVSAHNGHLGGSKDAELIPPEKYRVGLLSLGRGLAEFKTHNAKSFATLKSKGVQTAHIEHYIQMQVYMGLGGLAWGLYLAVNKDTDELHAEIIPYRSEIAEAYVDRAFKVIEAVEVPDRISNNSSWFECKFCDFHDICHHGKAPAKSCRTCVFSRPAMEPEHKGEWRCAKFNSIIPYEFSKQGCDHWDPIE